ncbi:MAG TPA: ChaN family lipoprotein [Ramlibacter sp.]|nr:ChaN family lipoprotein [Ramlibacter sp.]
MQRQVVELLAAQGRLAALAVEMAEQGHSTAGLGSGASQEQVRSALHWNEAGWPWPTYAPVVMAAVRNGVPVLGANLPRAQMAAAMADSSLDDKLAGPALKAQQQAIRSGHCDLLPESQIAPMMRIQIARDRSMAQVLVKAMVPGKTVVLIAGSGHVDSTLGIPQHLPASVHVQTVTLPPEPQKKDYCEEMRRQMKRAAAAATQ